MRRDAPELLEILYAQEDLWVLRAVMKVIQRTNEGASTRFKAGVKEIEFIKIGKKAVPNDAELKTMGEEEQGPGMGPGIPGMGGFREMDGGEIDMRGMSDYERGERGGARRDGEGYGGEYMFGMEGQGAMGPDPAEGRYVDKNYEPLPADELRKVMSSEEVDPETAYLAVAKRVPVRMRLKVDQRALSKLLVECATSELTIEIRQIRIDPSAVTDPRSRSAYGDRSPMTPRLEGGGRSYNRNPLAMSEDPFHFNFVVELYGIVYIFNPVDKAVLGVEEGEQSDEGAMADEESVAAVE